MIAFIFNSGTGKRLRELTENKPKALLRLSSGETLIARQIRFLKQAGINKIIISTGPFSEFLKKEVSKIDNIQVQYIHNSHYATTNNIYSLYLAKELLTEDCLILHGDLVFDAHLISRIIHSRFSNLALVNKHIPLPNKDFKGLIENNQLTHISVDQFTENSFFLQPLYKFSKEMIAKWLKSCENQINAGHVQNYAEDALNDVLKEHPIDYFDYSHHFVEEIDDIEDYTRVSKGIQAIDIHQQTIINTQSPYYEIQKALKEKNIHNPLIVHGKHLNSDASFGTIIKPFKNTFSDYSPNPKIEEVETGLKIFKSSHCDGIIAIGGGSCLDTAKAIKWLSKNKINANNLDYFVDTPLIAVPTTGGTGTESTRFSVIYISQEKHSISHDCLLPDVAILSPDFLIQLPIYARKSTLLDALCQAIESYWSLNSNVESLKYAAEAINIILSLYKDYISGSNEDLENIMKASNLAGKAINITRTSAPHAMSYKLTSLYGISHGHAVALTLPWTYKKTLLIAQFEKNNTLLERLESLASIFDLESADDLYQRLKLIIDSFQLGTPKINLEDIEILIQSINLERLKNHPVHLSELDIKEIYLNSLIHNQ